MAFVKIDCGILRSTLWFDEDARIMFLTALLMAEPLELSVPADQFEVRTGALTGWQVPPGWYGFTPAAGIGIARWAGVDKEPALAALERLGSPESDSRTPEFDGRRLVRIEGGYLVLNWEKYRTRDYTGAERSKRYRERKSSASRRDPITSRRDITQAEAEAEGEGEGRGEIHLPSEQDFDVLWEKYPRRDGRKESLRHFMATVHTPQDLQAITAALDKYSDSVRGKDIQYVKTGKVWFNNWRDWAPRAPAPITPSARARKIQESDDFDARAEKIKKELAERRANNADRTEPESNPSDTD